MSDDETTCVDVAVVFPTTAGRPAVDGEAKPAEAKPTDAMEARLFLDVLWETPLSVWAAEGSEAGYKICLWNQGAERTYGFSPSEAMGQSYVELFVNPDERPQAIEDHERIIGTEEEFTWNFFTAKDLAKDGKIRTILGGSFRVWDQHRQKYVLAEIGVDLSDSAPEMLLTERARELALLKQEAKTSQRALRAITLVNQTVMTLTDLDGGGPTRVVRAIGTAVREMLDGNPACRVWLVDGHTPRLAEGSDNLPVPPAVNELSMVGCVIRAHAIGPDEPGTDRFAALQAGQAHGDRGVVSVPLFFSTELLGVLLIFSRDGAEVEEAGIERLRLFGPHAAVGIAMAHLAGELQRRRQEEQERTRQAVIQSVLHTVGNEAGKAQLAADTLAAQPPEQMSECTRVNIERIRAATSRLGQIMGELMRLGEQAYEPARFRLAEAIRIVTRPVERDYYHAVEIRHRVDPAIEVQASEYLFREALSHVVGNAVQAMVEADRGGDLLIAASTAVDEFRPRDVVYIDVEDSGPGVLPEHSKLIFEHGYSTRGEGHGHGLGQCRSLMTMLGGSLSLVDGPSSLGGAHFRFTLPVAATDG